MVRHVILAAVLAAAAAVTVQAQAQTVGGAAVYQANCAMCHQAAGQGAAGLAPPLKGSYWEKLAALKTYVPGLLLAGMHGPLSTDEGTFTGVMPTQNRLSDADIAAVSTFLVQDLNGLDSAPAVSADEVAQLRARPPAVAELRKQRKQATGK